MYIIFVYVYIFVNILVNKNIVVFRSLRNIYDETFLRKNNQQLSAVTIFVIKLHR